MSIKSSTKPRQDDPEAYPLLKQRKGSKMIVLFSSAYVGTVVVGNEAYTEGTHMCHWTEGNFSTYHGSVALSNK